MPEKQPAKIAISELAAGHSQRAAAVPVPPPVSEPIEPPGATDESEGVSLRDALRSVYLYWRVAVVTTVLVGIFGVLWWDDQPPSSAAETRILKKNLWTQWVMVQVPDDWSRTLETDVALFQSESIGKTAQKLLRALGQLSEGQLTTVCEARVPSTDLAISPLSESVGVPVDDRAAQRLPWFVVDYHSEQMLQPADALDSSKDVMLLDMRLAQLLARNFRAVREAGLTSDLQRVVNMAPSQMAALVTVSKEETAGEIVVRCVQPTPQMAELLANLLPIAFIAANDRSVLTSNRRDVRIFEQMLQVAKSELANAEARYKLAQQKVDEQLAGVGQNNTVDSAGLSYDELRGRLAELQSEIRLREADLQTQEAETQRLEFEFRSVGDPLKREINELEAQYSRRLALETPESPSLQSLRARIEALKRQYDIRGADNFEPAADNYLAIEIAQSFRRAKSRILETRHNLELLVENREDLMAQLAAYPALAAPLENLRIEVEALQTKVATINGTLEDTRFKAAKVPEYYEWKHSATVSPAGASSRSKYLLGVVLVAILAGLAMTRVASMLDSRVQTESQVRAIARVPVLINLPILGKQNRFVCRDTTGGRETNGFVYNLFGILSINLRHLGPERPEKRLCVLSTMPGEGKSFVSFNLAAYYASQGWRTCLLQTDYRHADLEMFPELHADRVPGYIEWLAGNGTVRTLEDAIYSTDLENLFICVPGRVTAPPMYLFDSPAFGEFLADLDTHFDAVIIDTAPMLLVADTAVIARHAHAVVLVSSLGVVTKTALQTCIDRLTMQRLPVVGCVLNRDYMASYSYYYRYYGNALPETPVASQAPSSAAVPIPSPRGFAATSESAAALAAAAGFYGSTSSSGSGIFEAGDASASASGFHFAANSSDRYRFNPVHISPSQVHHQPHAPAEPAPANTPSDEAASSRRQPVVPQFETLPPVHDQPADILVPGASDFDLASPGTVPGPDGIFVSPGAIELEPHGGNGNGSTSGIYRLTGASGPQPMPDAEPLDAPDDLGNGHGPRDPHHPDIP